MPDVSRPHDHLCHPMGRVSPAQYDPLYYRRLEAPDAA